MPCQWSPQSRERIAFWPSWRTAGWTVHGVQMSELAASSPWCGDTAPASGMISQHFPLPVITWALGCSRNGDSSASGYRREHGPTGSSPPPAALSRYSTIAPDNQRPSRDQLYALNVVAPTVTPDVTLDVTRVIGHGGPPMTTPWPWASVGKRLVASRAPSGENRAPNTPSGMLVSRVRLLPSRRMDHASYVPLAFEEKTTESPRPMKRAYQSLASSSVRRERDHSTASGTRPDDGPAYSSAATTVHRATRRWACARRCAAAAALAARRAALPDRTAARPDSPTAPSSGR